MAAQVKAEIVLSQTGVTPAVGYVSGSREDLVYSGAAITAINRDNTGVIAWFWNLAPWFGSAAQVLRPASDFSPTGVNGQTFTCTPPPDGYGHHLLTLTVYGAPLPDGTVNKATATVVVGIRRLAGGVPGGIALIHPLEGGKAVIDQAYGSQLEIAKLAWALSHLANGVAGKGFPDILRGVVSSAQPIGSPTTIGECYFDPSNIGSTLLFNVLLSMTASAGHANVDLYRVTGGTPGQVANSPVATASLTSVLLTADITAALVGQSAGIFRARLWIDTPGSQQFGTATGCWLGGT